MYFRTILLSTLLAVEIAGVSAIASDWGSLIRCRGNDLKVTLTLSANLPQTRTSVSGATLVVAQNGFQDPPVRAVITKNDGTNLEVVAQDDWACALHKVIDYTDDQTLSGLCGDVRRGLDTSVVCQMGDRR